MKIDLLPQFNSRLTLPLRPVGIWTGSALPMELVNIPEEYAGGEITAVTVGVTNADGLDVTGEATRNADDPTQWDILFAGSNFPRYGSVDFGVRITATVATDEASYEVIVAVGEFVISQATADAEAGDPVNGCVRKGDDQYLKTNIIDNIQHYARVHMENNATLGWVVASSGDYILNTSGEFEPYSAE